MFIHYGVGTLTLTIILSYAYYCYMMSMSHALVYTFLSYLCLLLALFRGKKLVDIFFFSVYSHGYYTNVKTLKKIPCYQDQLYLGQGFSWNEHTAQSYYDIQSSLIPGKALVQGGDARIHGVGATTESTLILERSHRIGHTLTLGTTRSGKSRFCELIACQDILANETVIIFDPKNDQQLFNKIKIAASESNRTKELFVFHLAQPELSCSYNPIEDFDKTTEIASRITEQMPSHGDSIVFKDFSWRYVNAIFSALSQMQQNLSLSDIHYHAFHLDELTEKYLEHLIACNDIVPFACEPHLFKPKPKERKTKDKRSYITSLYDILHNEKKIDSIAQTLHSYYKSDQKHLSKITANLYPFLEKILSGQCGQLLTHTKPCHLNWRQVLEEKQIVYICLDALSDAEVARAVGGMMISDLLSSAAERYKKAAHNPGVVVSPVNLHIDEFADTLNNDFVNLINKSGGAGFRINAYAQTIHDLSAALSNTDKAKQILGNFNNLCFFRISHIETAEVLIQRLKETSLKKHHIESRVTDDNDIETSFDFTSQRSSKVVLTTSPLISVDTLMSLPKGHCFYLTPNNAGESLFKLRLPILESN